MNDVSKYIIVGAGILFIFITIFNVYKVINSFSQTVAFKIAGDPGKIGVFDPTIEFAADDKTGYMAYASIKASETNGLPLISVNLAASNDGGEDWIYRKSVFEGKTGSMTQRIDGRLVEADGNWRYEMPTLVYTPGDQGREWKLYVYRYFWNGDLNLARQTGTISYKYASDPTGEWSEEKWLFSANQNNPPSPYNRLVLLHVNVLSPQNLQNVIAYSDPGAFYKDGTLYITLSAYTNDLIRPERVIMISSNDYGASWKYVGSVFSRYDLAGLGDFTTFSGGQIFEKAGQPYLAMSLGDDIYNGYETRIFAFADLKNGVLARNGKGIPMGQGGIELSTENLSRLGGGPADYDEKAKVGLLISRMTTSQERAFQIGNYGHDFLD